MSADVWNAEWPNVNTQRRYPLVEGQTPADESFVLPNDFIVDLSLSVNATVATNVTGFYVASVGVYSAGAVISLAYGGSVFALVSVPFANFTEYSTYQVSGTGALHDTRGWITIGQIDTISQNPGVYEFSVTEARIVPAAIRPNLKSLASISVRNSTEVSAPITGDVILAAGRNMRLRTTEVGDTTRVIFDAIDSDDFSEDCECTDNDDTERPPIRTINGVSPSATGDISFKNAEGVNFEGGDGVLEIEDSTAVPCCGCVELDVLKETLTIIKNQVDSLDISVEQLATMIKNVSENVLASRAGYIPRTGE
jgi:hypothetical protein